MAFKYLSLTPEPTQPAYHDLLGATLAEAQSRGAWADALTDAIDKAALRRLKEQELEGIQRRADMDDRRSEAWRRLQERMQSESIRMKQEEIDLERGQSQAGAQFYGSMFGGQQFANQPSQQTLGVPTQEQGAETPQDVINRTWAALSPNQQAQAARILQEGQQSAQKRSDEEHKAQIETKRLEEKAKYERDKDDRSELRLKAQEERDVRKAEREEKEEERKARAESMNVTIGGQKFLATPGLQKGGYVEDMTPDQKSELDLIARQIALKDKAFSDPTMAAGDRGKEYRAQLLGQIKTNLQELWGWKTRAGERQGELNDLAERIQALLGGSEATATNTPEGTPLGLSTFGSEFGFEPPSTNAQGPAPMQQATQAAPQANPATQAISQAKALLDRGDRAGALAILKQAGLSADQIRQALGVK
jgi:hypothetical protein